MKILPIFFTSILISGSYWALPLVEKQQPYRSHIEQPRRSINYSIQTLATNRCAIITEEWDTTAKILLDVLFATNEDCDLYINDEFKGIVTKSEFKYLKLIPGKYVYKVVSKTTSDEFKESFSVKEGEANEIFIDLLYVIDEKKKQRENLEKTKEDRQQAVQSLKETADNKQEQNQADNKKAERTISELEANMVAIKGSNFIMGNNKAPSEDEVEHPVTINSVRFSKYEVTQQQWESIMGYNPSINKNCSTCPVENISWEEAMKFIRKINVISNKKFRLPTEAEWEYVARIGGKTEIEKEGGPEEYIKRTAWYFGNSEKRTHPVGQKQPNVAGIYDLLGNVSEWCSDWYAPNYYKDENNQMNPEGPPLGKEKVVRGGSFNDYSGDRFRPSLRNKQKPTTKSADIGFRLVMDINQ